jgi:hypothetical protein
MGRFLEEVSRVQQSVKRLNVNISDLQRLRSQSLGMMSDGVESQVRGRLSQLS